MIGGGEWEEGEVVQEGENRKLKKSLEAMKKFNHNQIYILNEGI